jgi:uncharacterized membrane protein YkgB
MIKMLYLSCMPHRYVYTFGRISLFVIYVWFGVLKLIGQSPANLMVEKLLKQTLPFVTFNQFIIALGIFEIILGILFLLPRFYKIAFVLFLLHMIMTTTPLFLIPQMVWVSTLIPTLEGQYIIKNLALASIVLFLYSDSR